MSAVISMVEGPRNFCASFRFPILRSGENVHRAKLQLENHVFDGIHSAQVIWSTRVDFKPLTPELHGAGVASGGSTLEPRETPAAGTYPYLTGANPDGGIE